MANAPKLGKYPLRILAICSSYKNSKIELAGVDVDKLNLYQFTAHTKPYPITFRLLEDESKETIRETIRRFSPNVVWMCGHGVLNRAGENVYLLDGMRSGVETHENTLTESEFTEFLISTTDAKVLMCVFDFCHSYSMLDLPYYYEDGSFYKKLLTLEKYNRLHGQKNHGLIITIAGCSDFETTEENSGGGILTQQLLYLIRRDRRLSLRSLNENLGEKARLSTNKIVSPDFVFLQI